MGVVPGVALGLALVSGCRPDTASIRPVAAVGTTVATGAAAPARSTSHPRPEVPTTSPRVKPASTSGSARLSAADRRAGVRSHTVAARGGGRLRTVPGKSAAPDGRGRVYRVRVEVESGLDVDRAAFAAYVLATLNDKRSWTENGRRRFARTDGAADIRVVLASPALSAAICRPLRTFGKLSCRQGEQAVLTTYRWVKAIPEYAGDHDGYRHYVVNHEVGHVLGHPHEYCAGQGRMAPVMMQQTKGLRGCRPNPWPHP